MSQERRLPVYLVLDVSGSMSGDPINQVRQGVGTLISDLQNDAFASEVVWLSIITFESTVTQVVKLTELLSVTAPALNASGGTSMGAALRELEKCVDREWKKQTNDVQGDWKPLIFLMTDGEPTDSWQAAADSIKKRKWDIIACAAGSAANTSTLKYFSETVFQLNTAQPDSFKKFFRYVTQSIKTTSASLQQAAANSAGPILPPPPAGITIVP